MGEVVMAGLWCKDLQFVTVERSTVPKHVTLIVPYYENPEFFAKQMQTWRWYPPHVAPHVSVIVVDDGSPESPASSQVEACAKEGCAYESMRLFRIEPDIRWNWLAARNIGAHHADDGWLLLTDMDHVVPAETMAAIVYGVHRVDTAYGFTRVEHTGKPVNPHSCSWLMTKALFWAVGGYDERFSGLYGTDGIYRRRLASKAKLAILTDTIVRYEFVDDSSTTRYQRKQPEDARIRQVAASIPPGATPKVLSFPYHEVTAVPA